MKPQRSSCLWTFADPIRRGKSIYLESTRNRERDGKIAFANCSSINKILGACWYTGASDIPLFGKLEGAAYAVPFNDNTDMFVLNFGGLFFFSIDLKEIGL